jgi:hypothetical protein
MTIETEKMDEIIRKVYDDLAVYEKDIYNHNNNLIKSFGEKAEKDFIDLLDFCRINGKIELVNSPMGDKQSENYGIFKNIHVDQWSVGMEGDSYEGFIYANVKRQWIKIPYYC